MARASIILKGREQRMLAVLYPPGASVARGLKANDNLSRRRLVELNSADRWVITGEGRAAIEQYPALLRSYLAAAPQPAPRAAFRR